MDLFLLVNRATRGAPLRVSVDWNVARQRIGRMMRRTHRRRPVPLTPRQAPERLLPDYYALLGVSPDAKTQQIEQRYRYLVNGIHERIIMRDNAARASAVQRRRMLDSAVAVLRSPARRADYDHWYAENYPESLKAHRR